MPQHFNLFYFYGRFLRIVVPPPLLLFLISLWSILSTKCAGSTQRIKLKKEK